MYGHVYTPEEKDFIRAFATGHTYKEIAEEYNKRFYPGITLKRVKGYLGNNKIPTGTTGQFKKGHVPVNKGNKGVCAAGSEKGWFKKGAISKNHRPVGSERIDSKNGYIYVKTKEHEKWELKHRVVWERHNGPVPKGKCIIFLNGDNADVRIENLTLIDRSVNARMNQNGLRYADADSTKAAVYLAELMTATGVAKQKRR